MQAPKNYTISGRVINHSTQHGLPNMHIEVWDKDNLMDDLVGVTETDSEGFFRVAFNHAYFTDLFLDRRPDLYFKVFSGDKLLKSTEDSVLWNIQTSQIPVRIELELEGQPEVSLPDSSVEKNIRKSSLELTTQEWKDYKLAIENLIKNGVYQQFVKYHENPNHFMHSFRGPLGAARFLAWHRAYLYYFEKELQKISGNETMTIPYWDWTIEPMIPPPLKDFLGLAKSRNIGANSRLYRNYEINAIATLSTFDKFTFRLENQPHNAAHMWVGGDMANIPTAPKDPIFWMHHAQIDRIWDLWSQIQTVLGNKTGPTYHGKALSGKYAIMDPWTISYKQLESIGKLGYAYSEPNFAYYRGAGLSFSFDIENESALIENNLQSPGNWELALAEPGYTRAQTRFYLNVIKSTYPNPTLPQLGPSNNNFDSTVRNGDQLVIRNYPYNFVEKDSPHLILRKPDYINVIFLPEQGEYIGLNPNTAIWEIEVPGLEKKVGVQEGQLFGLRNVNDGMYLTWDENDSRFTTSRKKDLHILTYLQHFSFGTNS